MTKKGKLPGNKVIICLTAIVTIGAFLRFWNIGAESLRLDEAQSIWQATHTLEFIRLYTLKNVHLPLHNTFLHFWITLFGSKETAIRISSAVFGVLILPALYLLSREFLKKKWALFATAVGAISPIWIWYSREIRMYTLLTFVTTLSYYFFLRILRTNKLKYYIFYSMTNLAGIYIHYFFLLVLLTQAVFFLSTWKIKWNSKEILSKKKVFYNFLIIAAILLIFFSPWLYAFIRSHGSGTYAPELDKPSSFNIILSFFEFNFGYQPENVTSVLIAFWPLIILTGFIFLSKRNPINPSIYLTITGTILPVFLTFMVSILYRPVYLTRYLIIITPLYYIFITWVLAESKGISQKVLTIILLGALGASLANQYTSSEIAVKENYREAVNYISENTNPRDIVALAPPYMIYPLQYYYRGPAKITSFPIWDKRKGAIPDFTPKRLAEDTQIIKTGHRRIFLFMAEDLKGGLDAKNYLDSKFTKLEKKQFSKTLWLNVYQSEYEPNEYVYEVKNGDTLSSIAFQFYQDYLLFKVIAEANNIENPNLIRTGFPLAIPEIN